jgi:HK97 family phage portal protein
MALFDSFFNRKAEISFAPPTTTLFGFGNNNTRIVNSDTAMRHTTIYSCVQIITDALSSVTLNLYKEENGKKIIDKENNLYKLLRLKPNRNMSSFVWRQTVFRSLLLRGNHYSQIVRNGLGEIIEIYPLYTDYVKVVLRKNGEKAFLYKNGKTELVFNQMRFFILLEYLMNLDLLVLILLNTIKKL